MTAVELEGIWKRFPGVIANAGASLTVISGSVHAVLGENGAGKTTLMNVLAGVYAPDEGTVRIDGVEQRFANPAAAIAAGVGMVYQEFRLIPSFTVAENVALGASSKVVAKGKIESQVGELAERFGLATEPDRQIWQLSMGERQRVEILKALWRDAKVLILDEPTAVLTPDEANELGRITRTMAEQGRSIIFISHKLDEVKSFCDEATVLRGGKTVARSLPVKTLDAGRMAELMVGEATAVSERRVRTTEIGDTVLSVKDLSVQDVHGRYGGEQRFTRREGWPDHRRSWCCRKRAASTRRCDRWPPSDDRRLDTGKQRRRVKTQPRQAKRIGLGLCTRRPNRRWPSSPNGRGRKRDDAQLQDSRKGFVRRPRCSKGSG